MIHYTDDLTYISVDSLSSEFFVGWLNAPSADIHLRLLQGSYKVWLALDGESVVGFITAISDGVLTAFIPLLEITPEYQGQGIGRELTQRMLASLDNLYSVDLLCDVELQAYYAKLGMIAVHGMAVRNYHNQAGLV